MSSPEGLSQGCQLPLLSLLLVCSDHKLYNTSLCYFFLYFSLSFESQVISILALMNCDRPVVAEYKFDANGSTAFKIIILVFQSVYKL